MKHFSGYLALGTILVLGLCLSGCMSEIKMAIPLYPKEKQLTIPENASNISFIQGRWYSWGMSSTKDKDDTLETEFEFNQFGQGRVEYRLFPPPGERNVLKAEPDMICPGRAVATLHPGMIEINTSGVSCPNGTIYADTNIRCQEEAMLGFVCRGINKGSDDKDDGFSFKLIRTN